MKRKYISWRRVSTFKQGKSGLGLEAQKEIIRYFIERDKGDWVADYEECYTGTELSGCVELRKAMNHAKNIGATLIIAKTDRFRNTAEALKIYEEMGDGHLMFCDLPSSDKFSLTLFFALAEREALIVSIRTKQALAVKKAHGCKLGASSDKYKETYYSKSKEERKELDMKRGKLKTIRHLESRDSKAFIRVLKNVFPEYTEGDVEHWKWGRINCKVENRVKMLTLMEDYRSLDESGCLFRKWDFSDDKACKIKLNSYMQAFRKSVLNKKYNA